MKIPVVATLAALLLALPAHAGLLDGLKSQVQQATTAPTTTTSNPQSADLVGSVMSQLNLSQTQAEGGLGSLLNLAKTNLQPGQFSHIADSIPNVGNLLSAAPSAGSDSGLGNLLSKAGNLSDTLQGSAMVYDAFNKLGISKELIAPMAEILKNYLSQSADNNTASLLTQGLGALL
ncbi:DUF2780 domain-containing protein [Shewanella sp. YIC-542]|uniref:DUF2780 domain-containing protein n=1 Tax=Shewanella mytili TaxID=3377111 RepID=UPI00398E5295